MLTATATETKIEGRTPLRATSLDPEQLISIPEGAELVRLSPATIRRYLTHKRLRRFKVGGPNGRTLVKVGDLMSLVEEV
jgi:hypothetical protein